MASYFAAATQAALVLAAFRAPYRGRSTPVNAWWGSFDLAVNLFSGLPADPPSKDFIMRNAMDAQEVAVGWWPGDARYGKAAFYAYAHPAPEEFAAATLSPAAARWECDARRVHPRLGRRTGEPRSTFGGARLRPLRVPPRLHRVQMGSGAGGHRGGHAAAGLVSTQSSAWRALFADARHGPLPALLLALTVLTGVVDAVSILSLGRVFVANMTGNVVFVGFAVGGAPGFSLGASLSALAGFLVGAFGGGRAVARVGANRAALVRNAVAVESALLICALVVALAVGTPFEGVARDALAAMLAMAMGLQNAAARRPRCRT